MPNKRITDLTLEKLRKLVQEKRMGSERNLLAPIGIGILLNEIGIIFLNGDKNAEGDLIALLDYSIGSRLAYYYLLKRKKHLEEENLVLVKKFERNKYNTDKIAYIKEMRHISKI